MTIYPTPYMAAWNIEEIITREELIFNDTKEKREALFKAKAEVLELILKDYFADKFYKTYR